MRKARFAEAQIAYTIGQVEVGVPVVGVRRKMGVSEQTFYAWKKKCAGMGIVELRRVKQLEDESRRLKSLVADLTLDQHMLQEVLRKNPEARGAPGTGRLARGRVPNQQAAGLRARPAGPVDVLSEKHGQGPDAAPEASSGTCRGTAPGRVSAAARSASPGGLEGEHQAGLPPVQAEGLGVQKENRKKRGSHLRVVPNAPMSPNERWSMDFAQDSWLNGRKLRALTVMDGLTRGCLAVHADGSLSGKKVAAIHEQEDLLIELRALRKTPEGRAALRERTAIEHRLARIQAVQGHRSRYKGAR